MHPYSPWDQQPMTAEELYPCDMAMQLLLLTGDKAEG